MWELAVVVALVLGWVLERQRRQADLLTERATRLRSVAEVTGRMLAGTDARRAVCEAARCVAQADLAYLMEPDGSGRLVARAASEPGLPTITVEVGEEPTRLRDATGAASLVVQSVPHEGHPPALLAVGWRRAGEGMRPAVREALELLATEAGIALERADLLASLAAEARLDPLTGVWNRRAWDERLAEELERARRTGLPLSVGLIDLDHFKAYNDRHGHQAGDRVLVQATAAWRARLRSGDLLARWGGEEFALLLPGCAVDDAVALLERVRACLHPGPTCSAGAAQWDGVEEAAALVDRADLALYEAKHTGRDRVAASSLSLVTVGRAGSLPCP